MSCLFNPLGCAQNAALDGLAMVPWWGWLALILVLLGVAWRFAGIPGLVAAAAGLGYVAGKFPRLDRKVLPPAGDGSDPKGFAPYKTTRRQPDDPGVRTPAQRAEYNRRNGIQPGSKDDI